MTMEVATATMEIGLGQDLPGFRFHPTEEELLCFYLSRVALGKTLHVDDIIGTLNIYRHDPWDLPEMAKIIGEREWYFFVPRDRKAGSGGRPNRTTERGFWKATGSDRAIRSAGDPKRVIGLKKTLVFYHGRAPRGTKTDWVMNEYRLPAAGPAPSMADMVLCKIYRKATPLKEIEERALLAMEETMMMKRPGGWGSPTRATLVSAPAAFPGDDYLSLSDNLEDNFMSYSSSSSSVAPPSNFQLPTANPACSIQLPAASNEVFGLPSLQLPAASHEVFDWLQDPFPTQLRSPWQEQHCLSPYAHLLYY